MCGVVVIVAGIDPHRLGRFDADIDLFREAVDDAVAFGWPKPLALGLVV
jgi:hypothetical protein